MRTRQSSSEHLHNAEQDWQIAGVEVQAKLRAYFPQRVVQSWENYRLVMSTALWAAFHREVIGAPLSLSGFDSAHRAWLGLTELGRVLNKDKSKFNAYDSTVGRLRAGLISMGILSSLNTRQRMMFLPRSPRATARLGATFSTT
jgi:hypothetical protein